MAFLNCFNKTNAKNIYMLNSDKINGRFHRKKSGEQSEKASQLCYLYSEEKQDGIVAKKYFFYFLLAGSPLHGSWQHLMFLWKKNP